MTATRQAAMTARYIKWVDHARECRGLNPISKSNWQKPGKSRETLHNLIKEYLEWRCSRDPSLGSSNAATSTSRTPSPTDVIRYIMAPCTLIGFVTRAVSWIVT